MWADVHADRDRTRAFLGAILADLNEPLAREVLQLQLALRRLQCIEGEGLGAPRSSPHLLPVSDMQMDQIAESGAAEGLARLDAFSANLCSPVA